jgi:hypothetical protein
MQKTSLSPNSAIKSLVTIELRAVMNQVNITTGDSIFMSHASYSEYMLVHVGIPALCTGLLKIISCDPDENLRQQLSTAFPRLMSDIDYSSHDDNIFNKSFAEKVKTKMICILTGVNEVNGLDIPVIESENKLNEEPISHKTFFPDYLIDIEHFRNECCDATSVIQTRVAPQIERNLLPVEACPSAVHSSSSPCITSQNLISELELFASSCVERSSQDSILLSHSSLNKSGGPLNGLIEDLFENNDISNSITDVNLVYAKEEAVNIPPLSNWK